MAIARRTVLPALIMSLAALTASSAPDRSERADAGAPFDARHAPGGWVQFVCLAQAIYFEARGETPEGQLAVGRVVLNRVASEAYPDTICDVVYQNAERANRCQFSFACDGKPEIASERAAWGDALDEAGRLVACKAACPDRSLFADPLWRSTHFTQIMSAPAGHRDWRGRDRSAATCSTATRPSRPTDRPPPGWASG